MLSVARLGDQSAHAADRGWWVAVRHLRVADPRQGPAVGARGGRACRDRRLQLPPLQQVLSNQECSEGSQDQAPQERGISSSLIVFY